MNNNPSIVYSQYIPVIDSAIIMDNKNVMKLPIVQYSMWDRIREEIGGQKLLKEYDYYTKLKSGFKTVFERLHMFDSRFIDKYIEERFRITALKSNKFEVMILLFKHKSKKAFLENYEYNFDHLIGDIFEEKEQKWH